VTRASRRNVSAEPPEPPALRIPRAEAQEKLDLQISQCEQLLANRPRTEETLQSHTERQKIWSDYNRDPLLALFTTSAVSEEYRAFYGGSVRINPSLSDRVEYTIRDLQTCLTRLRSIRARLELYAAPLTPVSNAIHT
jgi:hypothetical protein